MKLPIVCRKTVLVPTPTDSAALNDYNGQAKNGMVSVPVSAWRKYLGVLWPIPKEEGGIVKRRKVFPCEHTGFGTYCHRCKPNIPRVRDKALAGSYGDKVQHEEEKSKARKEVIKNGYPSSQV